MSRVLLFAALMLASLLAIAGWRAGGPSSAPDDWLDSKAKPPSPALVCPWREPEADMKQFFGGATRYEAETRILSGLRPELADRLGRPPTGEETLLRFYRIYQDGTILGTVLTRRVKGAYGAIELVLAVDAEERVRGLRLQRLREPEPVVAALQNPAWLRWFQGKQADSSWAADGAAPENSPEERESAAAVIEGARSLLVLLSAGGHTNAPGAIAHSHH